MRKFVSHSRRAAAIAVRFGWLPGARYTNLRDARSFDRLGFLDIDWREYDFRRHLAAARSTRPLCTVAQDVVRRRDLPRIIDQAFDLAQYADEVIIVPKDVCLARELDTAIPEDFVLGYSVPSTYGGTRIAPHHFHRAVHLLGGRPDIQRNLAEVMPVISFDCNRFTLDAAFGKYFDGKRFRLHPRGGYDRCLRDSVRNITAALWENYCPEVRDGKRKWRDAREKLLLQMYDQLFNDINTHIVVVWQSVGVVIGGFAVLALVEKSIITLDFGASLLLLLCGWLFANLLDSSYWYNRNLVMIANIERQFLKKEDAQQIHYYFTSHRPRNGMITHLQIQVALGVGVSGLVLIFHFLTRVLPGLSAPLANFDIQRALPYVTFLVTVGYIWYIRGHRNRSYEEFLYNSPGKTIDTQGIVFGEGHGFKRTALPPKPKMDDPKSGT